MSQRSGGARFFCAALMSSIILSLSVGAHSLGGGMLPAVPVLAAMGALVLLPVMVFARFRLSIPVVGGLLGGGQIILHNALEAFSASSGCAAVLTGGHSHHLETLAVQCAAPSSAGSVMHGAGGGVLSPMVLAHVVATLVAVWAITRGEQSLGNAMEWLSATLLRPITIGPVAAWDDRIVPPAQQAPVIQYSGRPPHRRGPPAQSYA